MEPAYFKTILIFFAWYFWDKQLVNMDLMSIFTATEINSCVILGREADQGAEVYFRVDILVQTHERYFYRSKQPGWISYRKVLIYWG